MSLSRYWRSLNMLDGVAAAGLAMAAWGLIWKMSPPPEVDTAYSPSFRSTSARGWRPQTMLIDDGHSNSDVSRGRYKPLTELISEDLFPLTIHHEDFHPDFLRGVTTVVIANPLNLCAAVERRLEGLGLLRQSDCGQDAFSGFEVGVLNRWIHNGGSLLFIVSDPVSAKTVASLARALGVGFTEPEPGGAEGVREYAVEPTPLGPNDPKRAERISRISGYGGLSIEPPPGALTVAREIRTGAVACAAFELGKGRVVTVADDALVTALRIPARSGTILAGINNSHTDNQMFVVNIIRWLARTR